MTVYALTDRDVRERMYHAAYQELYRAIWAFRPEEIDGATRARAVALLPAFRQMMYEALQRPSDA